MSIQMSRFVIGSFFKNHAPKNIFHSSRSLLTPVEHIERKDINIIPFFLVLSFTACTWGWESYQNLQLLKLQVNSFEESLQDCLQNNKSCEHIEDNLNSLFDNKRDKPSMLVRVNTKSSHLVELSKQQKPVDRLPLVSNDENE